MWSLDTGNKDNFYKPYYIEQSQSCSKLKRKHPKNNLEVAVNVKKKKKNPWNLQKAPNQ